MRRTEDRVDGSCIVGVETVAELLKLNGVGQAGPSLPSSLLSPSTPDRSRSPVPVTPRCARAIFCGHTAIAASLSWTLWGVLLGMRCHVRLWAALLLVWREGETPLIESQLRASGGC